MVTIYFLGQNFSTTLSGAARLVRQAKADQLAIDYQLGRVIVIGY